MCRPSVPLLFSCTNNCQSSSPSSSSSSPSLAAVAAVRLHMIPTLTTTNIKSYFYSFKNVDTLQLLQTKFSPLSCPYVRAFGSTGIGTAWSFFFMFTAMVVDWMKEGRKAAMPHVIFITPPVHFPNSLCRLCFSVCLFVC